MSMVEELIQSIPAHVNQFEILGDIDLSESSLESDSSSDHTKKPSYNGKKESASRNNRKVRVKKQVHKQKSSDSCDLYTTDGKPVNNYIVNKYLKQVKESKGFDIIDYPGSISGVTDITPRQYVIDDLDKCPEYYDMVMDMAALAIEGYNKKHDTNFKVAKIKKLNVSVCGGETNYITFSALNVEESKRESEKVSRGLTYFRQLLMPSPITMMKFLYRLCLLSLSSRMAQNLKAKLKKLKSPQNLKASKRELRNQSAGRYRTFQAKVWDGIGMEREVLFCKAK